MDILYNTSINQPTTDANAKEEEEEDVCVRACKIGGGRAGLPVPNSPYGFCAVVQELCKIGGGRAGPSLMVLTVSAVDVQQN